VIEVALPNQANTAALIVAAGRGTRANSGEIPKQYQSVGGQPILARAIRAFLDHPSVANVQVVIGHGHEGLYERAAPRNAKLLPPVTGAQSRQGSVRAGLAALAAHRPDRVLIHDAARPFVSGGLISRVAAGLGKADAVVPTLPVANTLKRVAEDAVVETVSRDNLAAAETPQGFAFAAIQAAHERAASAAMEFTDDAAVAEWAGLPVVAVPGDPSNMKLTTADDIAAADHRLLAEEVFRLGDVRVGIGYDVHPLGAGSEVMLGGVSIPHTRGLIGHSDADVVLHAVTDAILGALGEGDIGQHFPSTDDRWKGVSSDGFLADAVGRVRARQGIIAHLDIAYVGEGPKIAPYREAIRASIAGIAGIGIDRVGLKATTNEGLGFIGRGEGAAAHAVATIRLPIRAL
jgi:2-C-methyl-D-erythritol 4-phosphate cytidylyltransferase/2-C-methyl-D-erythritol 2,4-cyclodiphosphate synthase